MTIEIFEIETFKMPDGTEYEVIPLPTENVDLLIDLGKLMGDKGDLEKAIKNINTPEDPEKGTRTKKKLTKAEKEKQEAELYDKTSEVLKVMLPKADEIIDLGTQKVGSDKKEPFPMRYRSVKNRIQLTDLIGRVTMGNMDVGETNPK